MKTIFTDYDVKNIIANVFKSKDENILIWDEDGERSEVSLNEYLNIEFYVWKNRVVSANGNEYSAFETWVESLQYSLDKAFGLVETTNASYSPTSDIDSASITGKVTILIQTGKAAQLDYFIGRIRNSFLGEPQDIQNAYGDTIKAYISFGALSYDGEPIATQFGECMEVSFQYAITYLTDAFSYKDTKLEFSFDGETYYDLPYVKGTIQQVFTSKAVPKQNRPDITGFIATAVSRNTTISFYDFNKDFNAEFNKKFWELGAISVDGVATTVQDINIPVWVRATVDGVVYIYKDSIQSMEKVITNGDFNVSSVTLKGYGK